MKLLIASLKPAYIVHTGDMADNIKLELYPSLLDEYEKWIKRLAVIFNASGAEIVLALGNHDNFEIVSKYFAGSHIIEEAKTIEIESLSFRVSHLPEGILGNPSQYNLFGHDLTLKSGCNQEKMYFNGISYINIIRLETGEYTSLYYPSGTDDERLRKRKIGL
jgi:hypothetical protein